MQKNILIIGQQRACGKTTKFKELLALPEHKNALSEDGIGAIENLIALYTEAISQKTHFIVVNSNPLSSIPQYILDTCEIIDCDPPSTASKKIQFISRTTIRQRFDPIFDEIISRGEPIYEHNLEPLMRKHRSERINGATSLFKDYCRRHNIEIEIL